jgi:hypothetical protein
LRPYSDRGPVEPRTALAPWTPTAGRASGRPFLGEPWRTIHQHPAGSPRFVQRPAGRATQVPLEALGGWRSAAGDQQLVPATGGGPPAVTGPRKETGHPCGSSWRAVR